MTDRNKRDDAYRIYTDPADREITGPTRLARGTRPSIEILIVAPTRERVPSAIEQQLALLMTARR